MQDTSDRVVGDQGLSRAGRCTDEDVHPFIERLDGVELEPVQPETEPFNELTAVLVRGHLWNSLPMPMDMK